MTYTGPDDSQEHFTFRNHLCIAFELLSINLYEFIKQNNFMCLSLGLIRRFAQQMLVTLKFLKVRQSPSISSDCSILTPFPRQITH